MKEYTQNSLVKFGMYKGYKLEDIVKTNPKYIIWCVVNLDHFYLSEETIENLKSISYRFKISEKAKQVLEQKRKEMYGTADIYDCDYDYPDRKTYDDYNGSYAQDQMGWSDQDINDVFGGDADAYWNID